MKLTNVIILIGRIKVPGITQKSVQSFTENCLNILLHMQEQTDTTSCVLFLHIIKNNLHMKMKKEVLDICQYQKIQQHKH